MNEGSKWQSLDIENRIISILRDTESHQPDHHFGRPFITAYQLAIVFAQRHPQVVEALGVLQRRSCLITTMVTAYYYDGF
jgi:hypothetical protein